MASLKEYSELSEPTRGAGETRHQTVAKPITRSYWGTSEDLAHGQIVIVTARWILIIGGLALALGHPSPIAQLRLEVLALLLLAIPNFYLHAQVLMRRSTIDLVIYATSAVDLIIVTLLVVIEGGFPSSLFVFYFPALVALSVAFPTMMTFLYTGGVVAVYLLIVLATATSTAENFQTAVVRLLMIAAVATCGNLYLRIQGERRQEDSAEREQLQAELETPPRKARVA